MAFLLKYRMKAPLIWFFSLVCFCILKINASAFVLDKHENLFVDVAINILDQVKPVGTKRRRC